MSNPLLVFWHRLFDRPGETAPPANVPGPPPVPTVSQASTTIFLVLRRMRLPLIVLIVIFAVSVVGLTLIPGRDSSGQPSRMGFFDAFYFMSSTATTIGFGEIPHPFTDAQRLWVMFTIYLTVIGWAYAIGSLLALLQDRGFRQAIALQRFIRRVARLREPFLLVAGYGQAGEMVGRSLDALGRRFVVIDRMDTRIDALELETYHADVPGLVGDARNPALLGVAGLASTRCEGVLALTDDDETNLAVAMATSLLRPDLLVITRTVSPTIADRMQAFGAPTVVNPFDRFGDYLCLAVRAPASYQLMTWLTGGPRVELPPRPEPPPPGRWVVCGYGRFGRAVTAHLRREGLEVTVVEPSAAATGDVEIVVGDGFEPDVLARAAVAHAVGFVAGTDSDTTNLSLAAAARRANPGLFVTARQNEPANASLFAAMAVESVLVPTELVAREALARLADPLLWQFLQMVPTMGDAWAVWVLDRLTMHCGHRAPAFWQVRLDAVEAPALTPWLASEQTLLGDLLRNPEDRDRRLEAVPLMVLRDDEPVLAPDEDFALSTGDELLLAGRPAARRAFETTLSVEAAGVYVTSGRYAPSSWVWRRVLRDTDTTVGR